MSQRLPDLSELARLARPWHTEFWTEPPGPGELPFPLVSLGQPHPADTLVARLNTDVLASIPSAISIAPQAATPTAPPSAPPTAPPPAPWELIRLASENPFKFSAVMTASERTRGESESSWENYSDHTKSEQEEES